MAFYKGKYISDDDPILDLFSPRYFDIDNIRYTKREKSNLSKKHDSIKELEKRVSELERKQRNPHGCYKKIFRRVRCIHGTLGCAIHEAARP
jgi:hypothetical protein